MTKIRITKQRNIMGDVFYRAEVHSWLFGWKPIRNAYGASLTDSNIDRLKRKIEEINESNVVEEWTI